MNFDPRSIQRVLLAGLLASGLLFSSSADAQTPPSEAELDSIVQAINSLRADRNAPPLVRDERLDTAAATHAANMAAAEELTHVSEQMGDPHSRVRNVGIEPVRLGENIARRESATEAHGSLIESEAHMAQLLDPGFTHLGIAAAIGGDRVYLTELLAELPAPPEPEPQPEEAPPPPAYFEAPRAEVPPPVVQRQPAQPSNAQPPSAAPSTAQPVPPAPGVATPSTSGPTQRPNTAAAANAGGQQHGRHLRRPAQNEAPALRRGRRYPVLTMPNTDRPVTGYWAYDMGRWWYFPVPRNARPGQRLRPDRRVQGPPPGYQGPPPAPAQPAPSRRPHWY